MSETLHPDIPDAQIHPPKGFVNAVKNEMLVKDEQGALLWEDRYLLPPAKKFVSASSAPPTESNGDIYVIVDSSAPHADWDGAAEDAWVRFDTSADTWFSITPVEGIRCYDKNYGGKWYFDGSDWQSEEIFKKFTLTTSQILSLNSTPIEAVEAPLSNYAIGLIAFTTKLIFVTAAYDTNTDFLLILNGATHAQGTDTKILLSTASRGLIGKLNALEDFAATTSSSTQLLSGQALKAKVDTGNPGSGDSDLDIYILFKIIKL